VSLVSYRDRRCANTLFELFAHAERPSRISVGVVQQNEESDQDCFEEYCRRAGSYCRPDNVRVIKIPARKSRGVMVVRHYASSLYEGEEFFLQLDAHNKVTKRWDALLIADLRKVGNERAVLSHHPPATDSLPGWGDRSAINICKYEWDANGLPRFAANVVTAPSNAPFPGVFIGAGMVFARAELLIDCPFDSHLPFLFSGEELLLAACAFSHGWDLYNPSVTPVFHYYKGGSTGDKSINPVNDVVHAKSLRRLKVCIYFYFFSSSVSQPL
jgi:[Skp1-protein]-hydroxyproline N-acetylglucosaminyltransferase